MLIFDDVSKTYPNGTTALAHVSFKVEGGEFVFIVGPSGAGKTTLVKLLIREEAVTTGRIILDEWEINRLRAGKLPALRRQIGVVFQDFKLLSRLNVFENVAFALEVTGEEDRKIKEAVSGVLRMVGLSDKARSFPYQLSGGEKQRVSIARSMVHAPIILVADEVTGNIDPSKAWEIVKLLSDINENGTTVLMATHDAEIVDSLKKRVIALDRGRVVRDERGGKYSKG